MFDANAAHIAIGDLFFAEVHCANHQLTELGVKVGDVLLCRHVIKGEECTRENVLSHLWLKLDGEQVDYYASKTDDDDYSWLVYSGRPNGNGFICDQWKAKALAFLGGEWNAN